MVDIFANYKQRIRYVSALVAALRIDVKEKYGKGTATSPLRYIYTSSATSPKAARIIKGCFVEELTGSSCVLVDLGLHMEDGCLYDVNHHQVSHKELLSKTERLLRSYQKDEASLERL